MKLIKDISIQYLVQPLFTGIKSSNNSNESQINNNNQTIDETKLQSTSRTQKKSISKPINQIEKPSIFAY